MRENIGLYRGKRIDNDEWVEGFLVKKIDPLLGSECCFILVQEYDTSCIDGQPTHLQSLMTWYKVISETLGQYTELNANGKKIFEGDIIESNNGRHSAIFVVKYGAYTPKMFYALHDAFYGWTPKEPCYGFFFEAAGEQMIVVKSKYIEVIGNIHDNSELLEAADG